jgi:hypothetical protein
VLRGLNVIAFILIFFLVSPYSLTMARTSSKTHDQVYESKEATLEEMNDICKREIPILVRARTN